MRDRAVLFWFVVLVSVLSCGANQVSSDVRVELKLADQSMLIGEIRDSTISEELRIEGMRWSEVENFRIGKNGKAIHLEWENGDRLSAKTSREFLEIKTLAGQLKVPLRVIESGRTRDHRSSANLLEPAEVSVSGQYAHHKTEYAYDGGLGQSWSSGTWGGWIEFDLGKVYPLDQIVTHLAFDPPGQAVHEVFVSLEPMKDNRSGATRLKKFCGHRENYDILKVECGEDVSARYVQIFCPSSRAWFNVRELQVFAKRNGPQNTELN